LLIVITFEFHIEIVFQSTKFEQKLFNQETLRERAAITMALNSWPLGRSAHFYRLDQPEGVRKRGATGGCESEG
jgi:hypothetical protein